MRETSVCEVFLLYSCESTLLFGLSLYLGVVKLCISFSYELFLINVKSSVSTFRKVVKVVDEKQMVYKVAWVCKSTN